mgnify:CR=1 FL=1
MLNGDYTHLRIRQRNADFCEIQNQKKLSFDKKCENFLIFQMSVIYEIRFKDGDDVGHHLFIREHTTRVEEESRPSGKTILISNVPPWCSAQTLKKLFARFGNIENVQTQLKPGRYEETDIEISGRFTGMGTIIVKKINRNFFRLSTCLRIHIQYLILYTVR